MLLMKYCYFQTGFYFSPVLTLINVKTLRKGDINIVIKNDPTVSRLLLTYVPTLTWSLLL